MRDLLKNPKLTVIGACLGLAVALVGGCDKTPAPAEPGAGGGQAVQPAATSASPKATAPATRSETARPAATAVAAPPKPVTPPPTQPVESDPERPFAGKKIAVVHTSNVVGELEPCG